MIDNVNLPQHYARFKIEPIRFIVENNLNWFQGNIVKYSLRYDAKNGVEDLMKAARYNEMQIKFLNGDADWWKAEPNVMEMSPAELHSTMPTLPQGTVYLSGPHQHPPSTFYEVAPGYPETSLGYIDRVRGK